MIRRVIAYEWGKWWTRRESRITVIFLLTATAGYGLLLRLLGEMDLPVASIAGSEGTGFQLAFLTSRTLLRLLGLFLLIWGAASVAGELERGTLRAPLLRLPRRDLLLGKACFLGLVGAGLGLAIFAVAIATGAVAYGLKPVMAGQIVLQSRMELLGSGFAAALLTLLPLTAVLALGLCLSSLLSRSQAALSLSLVTSCLLWGAGLVPGVDRWLFPATLNWPFAVALSRSEGMKTLAFSQDLLPHCGVNLLWIALLLGLGLTRFLRRDLTR